MNFLVEAIRYFELVAEKIIRSNADTKETKSRKKEVVRDGEKQKNTARNLKLQRREVDCLTDKMKQPVFLNEAFLLVEEVRYQNSSSLQHCYSLIQVCPAFSAVVEQGFSLMNLIMND